MAGELLRPQTVVTGDALWLVGQQAALLSFVEVFRIMGVLFLAIVPLVLLMRKSKSAGSSRAIH